MMDQVDIQRLQAEHGLSDASVREMSNYAEPKTFELFMCGFDIIVKRVVNGDYTRKQYEEKARELYDGAVSKGRYER